MTETLGYFAELVQELEELLPGKEFSETLSEGLQAEAARSLYISAAEDMLKNLGCDGFKLLFDGKDSFSPQSSYLK